MNKNADTTSFEQALEELLRRRGIESYSQLAEVLGQAGYDFSARRLRELARADVDDELMRQFLVALAAALELSRKERADLVWAWVFG